MCVGPLCPGAASCEPLLVAVVAFGVAAGWQAAGGPGVAGNPEIAGNYCVFCLFFFFFPRWKALKRIDVILLPLLCFLFSQRLVGSQAVRFMQSTVKVQHRKLGAWC